VEVGIHVALVDSHAENFKFTQFLKDDAKNETIPPDRSDIQGYTQVKKWSAMLFLYENYLS